MVSRNNFPNTDAITAELQLEQMQFQQRTLARTTADGLQENSYFNEYGCNSQSYNWSRCNNSKQQLEQLQ
jgi:hypothetical protein